MTQTLHSPNWSGPEQPATALSPFKRFAALPEAGGLGPVADHRAYVERQALFGNRT